MHKSSGMSTVRSFIKLEAFITNNHIKDSADSNPHFQELESEESQIISSHIFAYEHEHRSLI